QDHRAIKRRVRASQHFRSFWGAWRTIAGYEAIQMIRKVQWGGCGGRSTAPLHSRSVRGDELNCRSSIIYTDFRLDYKLATLPLEESCRERIIVVEKMPFDRNRLPEPMQKRIARKFWEEDAVKGEWRTFGEPVSTSLSDVRYHEVLNGLSQ